MLSDVMRLPTEPGRNFCGPQRLVGAHGIIEFAPKREVAQGKNPANAAKKAGVEHSVYSSGTCWEKGGTSQPSPATPRARRRKRFSRRALRSCRATWRMPV